MDPIILAAIAVLILLASAKKPVAASSSPPIGNAGPMADTGPGDNSAPVSQSAPGPSSPLPSTPLPSTTATPAASGLPDTLSDGAMTYTLVSQAVHNADGSFQVALYDSVPPNPAYQYTPSADYVNGLTSTPIMNPISRTVPYFPPSSLTYINPYDAAPGEET